MKDQLDEMLVNWAKSNTPKDSHLKDLSDRIAAGVGKVRWAEESPVVFPLGAKLAYAALGAAAALVACLLFLGLTRYREASHNEDGSALARISTQQIRTESRLFAELERMFSKQLRWVSTSNGDVGLGVESEIGEETASSPLLVRIVVVARVSGERMWKPVWQADTVVRGQEMVEVAPNRKTGDKLALWVYPLSDGNIAVDTGLSLCNPVALTSRINSVAKPGTPMEMMNLTMNDTEYRVYQTVEPLRI
jgi:hypothetical protein